MAYNVTQEDLNILRQGTQKNKIKIELLSSNFKVLESLEGNLISDNYNQDSDSVQRRTYTCDFVITDSSFLLDRDKKIWLDKRIRVYYGVYSNRQKKYIWYLIGTFSYISVTYSYSQTEITASVSCADMMALYDGTLNGQIGGYGSSNSDSSHINQGLTIPAGEDIRASIIATLKDANIEKYNVEDIGKEIPYDLEFDTGVTYQEVWQTICELYDNWEYFFDNEGVFIWRQIPTCYDEPIILDSNIMKDIVLDESVSIDFSGIYNVTEVWRKVLELENDDRYSDTSTYSNNTYSVSFDGYSSWDDIDNLTMFGIKIKNTNNASPKISINGYSSIPIVDGDGNALKAGVLKADTIYVFRYRRQTVNDIGVVSSMFLLGQSQCYGKYVSNNETDPDNPFNVDNLGYEILQSLDYESLSDDAACYNQAQYETYYSTAMMDTITLTTLVVPWIEVNNKIEYTPLYSKKYAGETSQYIVKNLSWNTGNGTMTMTLYKFVESFSYVYDKLYG